MEPARPIGIFDSGVGGLTVARAIKDILPDERIYYIGDTANLPYGDKSTLQIQAYVQKVVDVLLQQQCKAIVIACNTATAAAADLLEQQIGSQVLILNVVDPVISYIKKAYEGKTLGLIGTQYTVDSNFYVHKLQAANVHTRLQSLATPLLVPMIETDSCEAPIVEGYLADPLLANIEGLILGCTHYWLIQSQIAKYYQNRLELINGAHLVGLQLRELLIDKGMTNPHPTVHQDHFMATSLTAGFQIITKRLFGEQVSLLQVHSQSYTIGTRNQWQAVVKSKQ
jgi:glutamate racemase